MALSTRRTNRGNLHDISSIRLRATAPGGIARAGGKVDGAGEIQFCRRQQRPRAGPGRRPDRRCKRGPQARGQDARHLWACQRSAGLPSASRISDGKAQARCRHRLRRRRYPDCLWLAAGARPRQRDAAGARRHRCCRAGYLSGRAESADPARRQRDRHPARPGGDADRRAGGRARRPQAPRRHAEIHSCRRRAAQSS